MTKTSRFSFKLASTRRRDELIENLTEEKEKMEKHIENLMQERGKMETYIDGLLGMQGGWVKEKKNMMEEKEKLVKKIQSHETSIRSLIEQDRDNSDKLNQLENHKLPEQLMLVDILRREENVFLFSSCLSMSRVGPCGF